MAVSKRLRYEVLLRDGFTCRYCGAKAPDVLLEVDHVIPRTLGGTDDLTNLVTACEPCNQGKAALALAPEVVAYITGEDELDPAISRGRADLACEMLGDLSPDERARLIAEVRDFDPSGSDDEVHVYAALNAWFRFIYPSRPWSTDTRPWNPDADSAEPVPT